MENRGSVWRKWDLHIHTKGTNKNDQFKSLTFEEYCNVLFKKAIEENVSVIGVTDYFNIDNYKKVLEYVKNIDSNPNFSSDERTKIKQMLLLPNVELRVLPVTDRNRMVNLHCIFNPSYIDNIDDDFFSSIEMSVGQQVYKMNNSGLIKLGKSINQNLEEQDLLKEGIKRFVVAPESIINLLKNKPELKNNTLVIVSNSNNDGASAFQQHYDFFEGESKESLDEVRKSIYHLSDMIFSSNEGDKKYFIGEKTDRNGNIIDDKKEVIKKCGSLKPCIHGSDAHTEDKIFKPNNNKFCWIKANPTFEGLKQIIYEPKLRCKIQEENPDNKTPHKCIKSVAFKGHTDFIGNKIFFNNDLNTIIGGKSSGKSLLLHYIANTIDYKYASKQQNPDNTENQLEDKYGFSEQQQFDFEITWNDNITYKFSERETIKDRKFVYIPQSYILNLTENIKTKSRKTLGKFIRDILLQNTTSNESYKEFIRAVKKLDDIRENYIDLYFKEEDKIKDLLNEKKEIGDKQGIENHLEVQTQILDDLKKQANITENELNRYNSLNNRLEIINNYKTNLEEELIELTDIIENHNYSISENHKSEDYNHKSSKKFIEEFNSIISKVQKQLNHLATSINQEKTNLLKRAEAISKTIINEISPIVTKLKDRTKIEAIEKTIKIEKGKLARIKKIEELINTFHEQEKSRLKTEILSSYKESFEEYEKIIAILNERGKDFEDIHLIGSIKFYHKRYRESLLPFFNANSKKTKDLIETSLCKDYGNLLPEVNYDEHIKEIENTFDAIVKNEFQFNKYKDPKDCVKVLFKDEFFDYWELKVGNDEMANMSPGKANLVILKLLVELSESQAPILIDQPEDNLDNRSIYHDLVKFLRKRKLDRQIIIVSHNPNIVVSSDSENVIVANQNDQDKDRSNKNFRFEYINGALENSFKTNEEDKLGILQSMGIREHVTDILEGGKEAFLKREEKYGF